MYHRYEKESDATEGVLTSRTPCGRTNSNHCDLAPEAACSVDVADGGNLFSSCASNSPVESKKKHPERYLDV